MKNRTMKFQWMIAAVPAMALLFSCEHPMTHETTVHEDGALDRSITFERAEDSLITQRNIYGINAAHGWSTDVVSVPFESKDGDKDKKPRYDIVFAKHFPSAEAMNMELNTGVDTLFHIRASFEKKFRWFYTYIRYSETYQPINRFTMLPATDFFNQEDFHFINRLPSEGAVISKADSVSLQMLNVKINEYYTNMAFFNEQYDILTRLIKANKVDPKWLDTLTAKREYIYDHVDKMKGDPFFARKMADSLNIPLPEWRVARDTDSLAANFNARLHFMNFAHDGKFKAIVNMPWTVVSTNADSVAGNRLFWRPLMHKFAFTEYELYAESRKPNPIIMAVSAIVVLLTLVMVVRKSMR